MISAYQTDLYAATEQPIYFKTGDFCRLKYDTLLRDGYNRIPANTIVYIEAKCNTSVSITDHSIHIDSYPLFHRMACFIRAP